MRRWSFRLTGLAFSFLAGCSASDSPTNNSPTTEPIALQLLRNESDLKGERFIDLLNFETPADAFFISTSSFQPTLDQQQAHTGKSSLRLSGNSGRATVKLTSLLHGQKFPGSWILAGAYFYSEKPAEITVSCDLGSSVVATKILLPPNEWSAAMLDLSGANSPDQKSPATLDFDIKCSGTVWCDDVILIDNTQWIVNTGQWSIRKSGYNIICAAPGEFSTRLITAEANPLGWKLQEANSLRARFTSTGKNKNLTIYHDGQSYWDGQYQPLAAKLKSDPTRRDQHISPADIEVPDYMGRVDRTTDGDQNNDGYNELRAAYQIVATGPRLHVKIIPRSVAVDGPTLEISGLAPGTVLCTVEGQLIEKTVRLENGTLLVQIPARIERPTMIDLRVVDADVR